MEKSCLRLRLAFKKGNGILSKTQKSLGLKKSWILLQQAKQQELKTIADLSAHIIQTFHLHQSCPHGLLLSMDGFILPPFEPLSILKDKDIISVKKKGALLLIRGSDATDDVELEEKQPANRGALLLADEHFENESGRYQSTGFDEESEGSDDGDDSDGTEHLEGETTTSKKRKALKELHSSKKKKQRPEPSGLIEKKGHAERIESSHQGVSSRKKTVSKEKLSNHDNATTVKKKAKRAKRSDENADCTPSPKRNQQLLEDAKDNGDATCVTDITRKSPSRSARRKKAKRTWLKEMAKIKKKGLDSSSKEVQNWKQVHDVNEKRVEVGNCKGLLHWKQCGKKDTSNTSGKNEEDNQKGLICQRPIQNGAIVNEVPVLVRPGHIRFGPREDQAVPQSQPPVDTFQWNGITSKKQGQKWGTNRSSVSHRGEYRELKEHAMSNEKDIIPTKPTDFDKLPPLPNVPSEGDVIAYRLLELSSSWTPEISSYRVGRVSWYNPKSRKIMLISVQGFPIHSEKLNEDESARPAGNHLYEDDGSLEIDFRSLVDVRIIKNGNSTTVEVVPHQASGGLYITEKSVASLLPSSSNKQKEALIPETGEDDHGKYTNAPSKENGVNPWEQFSQALSSKKEEVSKENGWGKVSSSRSSWSFRTLKGRAVGPTMSVRAGKQGKR